MIRELGLRYKFPPVPACLSPPRFRAVHQVDYTSGVQVAASKCTWDNFLGNKNKQLFKQEPQNCIKINLVLTKREVYPSPPHPQPILGMKPRAGPQQLKGHQDRWSVCQEGPL